MWGRNWLKKRKSKKAFRIIAMNKGMCRVDSFYLCFPKHIANVQTQKKTIERIIEKHHKEIRLIQPIQMQAIHLHRIYHIHNHRKKSIAVVDMVHRDSLRKEIRRLQYVGFLEEQEYFRTRPTMAKNLFQNMMKGKDTYILQGGEKVRPIHLEILKNVIPEHIMNSEQEKLTQPQQVVTSSTINYTLISQVVREVSRQMKKEAWRTGGKS